MCEVSGRRCPCDTSAARQARRDRDSVKKAYSQIELSSPSSLGTFNKTEIIENSYDSCVTKIHSTVEELHGLLESSQGNTSEIVMRKIDELNSVVGENVAWLAEEKYGAPTNEQMVEAHDMFKEELAESLERKRLERAEIIYRRGVVKEELKQLQPDFNNEELISWSQINVPELHQKYVHESALYEENQNSLSALYSFKGDQLSDLFLKRGEAYRKALHDIGVEFSNPGDIVTGNNPSKDMQEAMAEAAQYIPKAWVKNSNDLSEATKRPLIVKKGRGDYGTTTLSKTREYPSGMLVVKPEGWEPDRNDFYENCFVRVNESGLQPGDPNYFPHKPGDENSTQWFIQEYEPVNNENEGEEYSYYETIHKDGQTLRTGNILTARRKAVKYKRKIVKQADTITVSASPIGNFVKTNSQYTSTFIHEFSHRAEESTLHIKKIENAFLQRRGGRFDPNRKGTTGQIPGMNKTNQGWDGGFPEPYTGRIYTTGATELLSTGQEALWIGIYGGYTTINGDREDTDMRNSVLGIIATTARTINT